MNRLGRLRRWINRDDGYLIRVGNAPLGAVAIAGYLSLLAGLLMHLLREPAGLPGHWAAASAMLGIALLGWSAWRERR
ncbi:MULTISPECIES: hypothetical protein [Stenotrophomonas]|uniref:hypothetical protein n=1 Tax=Stenotrophomonas TaxID=40323 RepID=UPI0018D40318|nr:hypothetical protein [Stenotrophomonas sp.]MBH1509032.1 hypothetical protein [Stenotrophomonas maltophilia]